MLFLRNHCITNRLTVLFAQAYLWLDNFVYLKYDYTCKIRHVYLNAAT